MPTTEATLPVAVKRYAQGRLYDPAGCRYVTLMQLRRWVDEGITVTVTEAETGEDVTRVLLS